MKRNLLTKASILIISILGFSSCAPYVNDYLGAKIPEPKTFNKITFEKQSWGCCNYTQSLSRFFSDDASLISDVLEIHIEGIPEDDLKSLYLQISDENSWNDLAYGAISAATIVTNLKKDTPFDVTVALPLERNIKKNVDYTFELKYENSVKEEPISINKFQCSIEKKSPGFTFAKLDSKSKTVEHSIRCYEIMSPTTVTQKQYVNIKMSFDASKAIPSLFCNMSYTKDNWASIFYATLKNITEGKNEIQISIPVAIASSITEPLNTDNCLLNFSYTEEKSEDVSVLILKDFDISVSVSDKAEYKVKKN